MTTVVCCGAATLDVLFRVAKIPTGPGKILPTAMLEVAHGMATSAAAAVSRLGGKGRLIARVGDDAAGERFVRDLTEAGVDCSIVRRVPGARSPLCTVLIDDAGDRLVVPYYDPALGRDVDWLPLAEVAAADAALVDVRWPEGAAAVLDTARAAGIPAILDADVGPPEGGPRPGAPLQPCDLRRTVRAGDHRRSYRAGGAHPPCRASRRISCCDHWRRGVHLVGAPGHDRPPARAEVEALLYADQKA